MLTFHDIYSEHAPHVHRFALFLTRDNALADDLTSETFLRAWAASERMEAATMRSYLLTVTRNLHRDHIRRHGRITGLDESLPAVENRIDERIDARRIGKSAPRLCKAFSCRSHRLLRTRTRRAFLSADRATQQPQRGRGQSQGLPGPPQTHDG